LVDVTHGLLGALGMKQISIREVRAVLPRLDEVLAREGELVITRHGKAIARLLPPRATAKMPSHRELRESMPPLSVGSEVYIRQDRDER
jgi:antitoxin (DNA-binding transcriptional repressor) of toxin-antitoxin stability system